MEMTFSLEKRRETRCPSCTFCDHAVLQDAFTRNGHRYVRCGGCRAFLQVIDRDKFAEDNHDFYQTGILTAKRESELGEEPAHAKFREFQWCLRRGSLLEIGPGPGHFLAAARDAGFSVNAIETSDFHRKYIRMKWQIEASSVPLERNMFAKDTFDNIVSFNCLEHIMDPAAHFAAAFRVLKPGGRFLISTANADCLVAKWAGRYWAMFKPPDHLSIPSPQSLRIVGELTGFHMVKVWCSEYPLETPLGFAVALRDRLRDLRGRVRPPYSMTDQSNSAQPAGSGAPGLTQRLLKAKTFACVGNFVSYLMLAASVKALYEKPR